MIKRDNEEEVLFDEGNCFVDVISRKHYKVSEVRSLYRPRINGKGL